MTLCCLDCGVRTPDERTWCGACGSTSVEHVLPPRPVAYCPVCSERWPLRAIAMERGTPVQVLCSQHLDELRQRAAERVEVIG